MVDRKPENGFNLDEFSQKLSQTFEAAGRPIPPAVIQDHVTSRYYRDGRPPIPDFLETVVTKDLCPEALSSIDLLQQPPKTTLNPQD